MKRRGFLSGLIGAAVAAPAVVLAKDALKTESIVSTKGVDHFIKECMQAEPLMMYAPDSTPLLKMAAKMKGVKTERTDKWLNAKLPLWYGDSVVEHHSIGEAAP